MLATTTNPIAINAVVRTPFWKSVTDADRTLGTTAMRYEAVKHTRAIIILDAASVFETPSFGLEQTVPQQVLGSVADVVEESGLEDGELGLFFI